MRSKKKGRICYISFRRSLETNFEQLSRKIASRGYEVSVILFSNSTNHVNNSSFGRQLLYVPIGKYFNKNKKIQSRIEKFLFSLKAAVLLKSSYFDIIHVDASCKFCLLFKILARKSKYVYHIQSLPMSVAYSKIYFYRGLISVFLQSFMFNAILIQSNEQKKKWIGIRNLNKTKILPIGYNGQILYPISKEQRCQFRKEIGISLEKTVLIYAGAISKLRKIEVLVYMLQEVIKYRSDVLLLLVGYGDGMEEIERLAIKLGVKNNLILCGKVAYEEMNKFYGISDIGLSYIPKDENYNYNPPLKTYEYLACSLACVATNTKSNTYIIKNKVNGIIVNDTALDIAQAVVELLKNTENLSLIKKNARESIKNNDFDIITNNYLLPLYNNLMENN